MLNFTAMIQGIDTIFTNFIFIPALLILYLKFRPRKPWNKRTRNLYATFRTLAQDIQFTHAGYPVLEAISNLYLNKQIAFEKL